ncbi:xanthine dehydrogenase molybdopterin binding subunit [Sessilibacter sp. MAH1]
MRNIRPGDAFAEKASNVAKADSSSTLLSENLLPKRQRPRKSSAKKVHPKQGSAGKPSIHESAIKHVSGLATYIDDIPELSGTLHMAAGGSAHARAKVIAMNFEQVLAAPGVVDVFTAEDVPGELDIGPVFSGDPLFVTMGKETQFVGQTLFVVVAKTYEQACAAAKLADIQYEVLTPNVRLQEGLDAQEFVLPEHIIANGDANQAINSAEFQLRDGGYIGGQEHFYLEGQICYVLPGEDNGVHVFTSSQHPTEVQKLVAEVLDLPSHKVVAEVRRMGGGFGGKETQAAALACAASVAVYHLQQPVKFRLPRKHDMEATGKRHDFKYDYEVGFNQDGVIEGLNMTLAGLCGCSPDLSQGIVDRAMFHADNAYFINQSRVLGLCPRTHTVSNTAFRGFGGPQGMVAIEAVIDGIARSLGEDPLTIRKRNLYRDGADITHYGQQLDPSVLQEVVSTLETSSEYWARREAVKSFNAANPFVKKGLALTPVKFGISFTAQHLNQAGALVHVYTDGSILVNHGGTEMGQGLYTKIAQIVADEFGVDIERVQVSATRTDKVANTSPTAASSGTDLNGYAAKNACQEILQNFKAFAAEHYNVDVSAVSFSNDQVFVGEQVLNFADFCLQAYKGRVPLMAYGFYKTPKIYYDRDSGHGHPFFYFANGAACSEVLVDSFTGEYKVLRTDILHDVGKSVNPDLDIGQIEGAFIQGMGWLTTEELLWDDQGRVMSNSPASYKIPTAFDVPREFNIALYERENSVDTVFNSKAVGEPPLMLAISVWSALADACASFANYQYAPRLDPPATPEKVLKAIEDAKLFAASKDQA